MSSPLEALQAQLARLGAAGKGFQVKPRTNLAPASGALTGGISAPLPMWYVPPPPSPTLTGPAPAVAAPPPPPAIDPNIGGGGAGSGGAGDSAPAGGSAAAPGSAQGGPSLGAVLGAISSAVTGNVPGFVTSVANIATAPPATASLAVPAEATVSPVDADPATTSVAPVAEASPVAMDAPTLGPAVSAPADAVASDSSDADASSSADADAGPGDGPSGDAADGDGGGGGGGGGGGCFLTSAVMRNQGKDDDSVELALMRGFRDHHMMADPALRDLVYKYYQLAPKVVKQLDKHPESDGIYQHLHDYFITPGLRQVMAGDPTAALKTYSDMLRFVGPLADSHEGDLLGAGGAAVSNALPT